MGDGRRRTRLYEQHSRFRDGRVRTFIARASNRDEDRVEKADTALAGVAAQLLERGDASSVVVVTTDHDAGEGVVRALEAHGFDGRIEFKDGFELIEEIM